MGRTAFTEPQRLYNDALYFTSYFTWAVKRTTVMWRMHLLLWPGTEAKGVRERDENKTGWDRRIFFGWMTTFVAIHQLQERGGESGRPWPWPPYYWLSLRECDPHAERESEWASERTRPGTTEEPGDATMERALHTTAAGEEGAAGSLG